MSLFHPLAVAQDLHPVGLPGIVVALETAFWTIGVIGIVALVVACYLADRHQTGQPSFITRAAAAVAQRAGAPIWQRLPFLVVLGGLVLALVGWRTGVGSGPLAGWATVIVASGLGLALGGGVIATAIAHPPARVVTNAALDQVSPQIAHPPQAHRVVTEHGHLGAGPIGAGVVIAGGVLALLTTPVAALWRAVQGTDIASGTPATYVALVGATVMTVGAWLLHAEGRRLTIAAPRFDVLEIVAAGAVLLSLSTLVDTGLDTLVAGAVGLAALVVVRARAGLGAAVGATTVYLAARLLASTLGFALDGGVGGIVPLAWQAVVAALAVEVLVGASLRTITDRPGRSDRTDRLVTR